MLGATQRLQAELRAAELRADGELQVLHAAEQAHDAARAQVAEARAALDEHTKRQRTEPAQVSLAPTCALARGPRSPPARRPHPARVRPANFPQFRRQASLDASTVPEHPRVKLGGSNPPNWHKFHSYTRSKYQEVKEQDRHAVVIDMEQRERAPPADDRWGTHWRRGVYGVLRGWAKGKLGAVIFMLAACAPLRGGRRAGRRARLAAQGPVGEGGDVHLHLRQAARRALRAQVGQE